MKAMILAAGLGTRLRPVTDRFAKPAVQFLNIPLLYYSIALLEEGGADQFVINAHYKPEQIEHLAKSIPGHRGLPIVSLEKDAPLGSGGGIWKAKQHLLGGDFFLANGDEVILPHDPSILAQLRDRHQSERAIATILVMRHPLVGTQFGGVWADSQGNVRGFGKDGSVFGLDCHGYHYIGLQILSDRIFNYLPDGESNILYDALAAAIAKGEKVRILESEFTWFETGNVKDFLHATEESLLLLSEGRSADADFLKKICQRFWPSYSERASFWKGHGSEVSGAVGARKGPGENVLLVGNNVRIENGASIKGFAVIGDNSVIKNGAYVENSVVLANSTVESTENVRNGFILPS